MAYHVGSTESAMADVGEVGARRRHKRGERGKELTRCCKETERGGRQGVSLWM